MVRKSRETDETRKSDNSSTGRKSWRRIPEIIISCLKLLDFSRKKSGIHILLSVASYQQYEHPCPRVPGDVRELQSEGNEYKHGCKRVICVFFFFQPPLLTRFPTTDPSQGVDAIYCIASNDCFVTSAWAKSLDAGDKVSILADGDCGFAKLVGLTVETGGFGGLRLSRFSALVEDGSVKKLHLEEGGGYTGVSGAEQMLKDLE